MSHTTSVEVVGETEKSYKVKLLNFGPYSTRPGSVIYVRKKSVRLETAPFTLKNPLCNRLPYKD